MVKPAEDIQNGTDEDRAELDSVTNIHGTFLPELDYVLNIDGTDNYTISAATIYLTRSGQYGVFFEVFDNDLQTTLTYFIKETADGGTSYNCVGECTNNDCYESVVINGAGTISANCKCSAASCEMEETEVLSQ